MIIFCSQIRLSLPWFTLGIQHRNFFPCEFVYFSISKKNTHNCLSNHIYDTLEFNAIDEEEEKLMCVLMNGECIGCEKLMDKK
jgi:hypothetical protein